MNNIVIKQTLFQPEAQRIRHIREQVFIIEQNVPRELEWDEYDDEAIHLLVLQNEQPIATSRILKDGHIGRMAVMSTARHSGIGSMMLQRLIKLAKEQDLPRVFLSAQVAAIDFYRKHGFNIISDTYMDAGIPHRDMELHLNEHVT